MSEEKKEVVVPERGRVHRDERLADRPAGGRPRRPELHRAQVRVVQRPATRERTGFAGGRPKVEEIMAYFPALIPKSLIGTHVDIVAA